MKQYIYYFLALGGILFGASVQAQSKHSLVSIDCGTPQDKEWCLKGEPYTFELNKKYSSQDQSVSFGTPLMYGFKNLNIHGKYQLKVNALSDQFRKMRFSSDGNVIGTLEVEKNRKGETLLDIPPRAYAYGTLLLEVEALSGANAAISSIELLGEKGEQIAPFTKEERQKIVNKPAFAIEEKIDIEKFLPIYRPIPNQTEGVYSNQISLDGIWNFVSHPNESFLKSGKCTTSSEPQNIVVPGEWAMQGFKVDSAKYAAYTRDFTLPRDWERKEIYIRFEGVSSQSTVWINGNQVATHLGGMTPFEANITAQLHEGTNHIAVAVRNESLADMLGSLTQYAAHSLGGITRSVKLYALPSTHVSDLRIVTSLDDQYRDAMLNISYKIEGKPTDQNQLVFSIPQLGIEHIETLERKNPNTLYQISIPVSHPQKWTCEAPNLYNLHISLLEATKLKEEIVQEVGFREVEVKGNQLLVNGVAVKLHGVCRHEVYPLTGRTLNTSLWKKDVDLYRKANCNFVRTSHYPPPQSFIDECNRQGIFVELESPLCWIGHGANYNWRTEDYRDPKFFDYMLQADLETIHYYRNNPSIVYWSMANESLWSKNFARVQEYDKLADSSRPLSFHDQAYGGFNNQGSNTAIANYHYPGPNGYKQSENISRPLEFGEYCHLNVYNRRELVTDPGVRNEWANALAPTWENMYKTQGVLGGSIWSGIDDVFILPDGSMKGYGEWGPIDGWRRPKPEYWHMKKIYSPIKMEVKELPDEGDISFNIENRYLYTDLNTLSLVWQYGDRKGVDKISAAPKESALWSFHIPQKDNCTPLHVWFKNSAGDVIDEYIMRHPEKDFASSYLPNTPTVWKKENQEIVISGKEFQCRIDATSGHIISLIHQGHTQLKGGPWLMILPLDGGECFPDLSADIQPFNPMCSQWKATSVKARNGSQGVEVVVKGSYKEAKGEYTMSFNSNGEMDLKYNFKSTEKVNPRQWGMVLEAPQEMQTLFWKRKGRWSVYPTDHIGRTEGKAQCFYPAAQQGYKSHSMPWWSWSQDRSDLGSNDFRATRTNIYFAGLEDKADHKITVLSNGSQHFRSWYTDRGIQFLIANFNTAGNELFLGSYMAPTRKPLKPGDEIVGKIHIRL